MKKMICGLALLLVGLSVQAADAEINYTLEAKGTKHSLKMSNWKRNAKGAVSFDYQYEQSGSNCKLSLQGRADTRLDDSGEPEVYNVEDGKGGDEQIIVVEGGALGFSFSFEPKPPGKTIIMSLKVDAAMKKNACSKKEGRNDFKLKKAA